MSTVIASEANPGRENEDCAVGGPELVVVVDGAGTPKRLDTGCVHGTAWYARRLALAMYDEAVDGTDGLADGLATAIERTARRHAGSCDLGDPMTPSATVAVLRVRQQEQRLEWLVLADATVALDLPTGPLTASDHRVSELTRAQRVKLAEVLAPLDPVARLDTLVRAQRSMMNVHGGYWVAAADPKAAGEALTGSVPLAEVGLAAALSDGAARLVDDFGVMGWPGLLALLAAEGPAELIARTRAAERSDPDGLRWPRGKRHDDATAAIVRLD